MGKSRQRYNEKARQQKETIVDNSSLNNIKLDFPVDSDGYKATAGGNELVLPSQKRHTKFKKTETVSRILSKKQRKKLEKIVEKKKKKEQRADILESLAQVQIPDSQLKQYTSLSTMQTKGLKKLFHEQKFGVKEIKSNNIVSEDQHVKSIIKGHKRAREEIVEEDDEKPKKPRDYNVVGVDDSSSSEEEDEDLQPTEVGEELKCEMKEVEIITEIAPEPTKSEDNETKETTDEHQSPPDEPVDRKPSRYVHVERDSDIQIARLKLPILAEEQIIMETISENTVTILAGETGSGKTTQVPQFLYEAGYANDGKIIGVTEPRRVAAIAMSQRVSREMNLSSSIVSYLIRFEGNCTPETKVKFMTDGVLLKEVESDFLLTKYSVIILDEAHERSAYTDILIGLLSRIVLLRKKKSDPLKLIVMSATLRVEDFTKNTRLFKDPPPVIKVDARQFPVTIHFNKVTAEDYVREALLKTIKIHTKLPEGGILVFVTGQQEVRHLVKKLKALFPYNKDSIAQKIAENDNEKLDEDTKASDTDSDDEFDRIFDVKRAIKHQKKKKKELVKQMNLPKINLDNFRMPGDDTEADFNEVDDCEFDENEDEVDEKLDEMMAGSIGSSQPLWVLPLYSLLSTQKQAKVFQEPPEGTRLCVIATNVAETSLTIPGIKYVVDSGRQKTKFYDKVTGVNAFVVTYSSKAAADQRAGRAGRVAPGHCYRLFSSAVFNDQFIDFSPPEIQQKPIDGLVLQMKSMGIDKVVNFPFPSPPDKTQLEMAEKRLKLLGALENTKNVSRVTKLGNTIAAFPVAPRYGKMLALSHQQNLLEYTICMVASLSVQEVLKEVPLSNEEGDTGSKWRTKRKAWAGVGNSLLLGDPMILLKAVGAAEYAHTQGKLAEFCDDNGLRLKAVQEIRKLRVQLTNEINLNVPNLNLGVNPKMEPPTDLQAKLLRQILLSGLGDQVARKIPEDELKLKEHKHKLKHAYQIPEMEEPVFMHSCSILKKKQPEWIVYQEIYEMKNGESTKMFLRGCTTIEPEWLLKYVPDMCNITKTLEDPEPRYDADEDKIFCHVEAAFGRSGWPLSVAEIDMPESLDKYRHFAKFLLNGDVFESLTEFKKHLLSAPSAMTKSWSKLIPRTEMMLNTLANHQVDSKAKMKRELRKDPDFLLKQFTAWIPEALHFKVTTVWKEMLK